MGAIDLIKADKFRYVGKDRSFLHTYLRYEGFRFSVWLRICHSLNRNKLTKCTILMAARLVYKHYKYKYGYDIPYQSEIGPGLCIYHFGGVVFSAKSAGKNLTISQNTTVGMRIYDGEKKYPVIGDNLYLAPGAAIVGNVVVGNNVAIGTNAVLLENACDKSVYIGIPGKKVSLNGSLQYISNPV